MMHDEVFNQFKLSFSQYKNDVELNFPNGKNSVRVRLYDGNEFIFTYNGKDNWCLETVSSYISHLI